MTSQARSLYIDVSLRKLRWTLVSLLFCCLKRITQLFDLSFLAPDEPKKATPTFTWFFILINENHALRAVVITFQRCFALLSLALFQFNQRPIV